MCFCQEYMIKIPYYLPLGMLLECQPRRIDHIVPSELLEKSDLFLKVGIGSYDLTMLRFRHQGDSIDIPIN